MSAEADADDIDSTPLEATNPEVRAVLGTFDLPAFARRGQDLEHVLKQLDDRCRRERDGLLEIVRLRLRQWCAAAPGPDAWTDQFQEPIALLWPLAAVEPTGWAAAAAPARRRRAVARDLAAAVERFNRRWTRFLQGLNLGPVNSLIDHYNRFYVLEKECVVRSPRLAARNFEPRPPATVEGLLQAHPLLPAPILKRSGLFRIATRRADHPMSQSDTTRRLKGVIYDMDGVLVESEPFIAEAAIQMFAELGHALRIDEFRPFVGTGEDRFLGGPAEVRGIALDLPRAKARTYQIYLELIRGRLEPLDGAKEHVVTCRERGLKLALASSADTVKVGGNLAELHLPEGTFDAIVTGDDVTRKKPAPDIFQEAARRLGLAPSSCLVVEDAVSGVTAARSAGCRCLGLTSTFTAEQLVAAGADWTAPDLAAAPAAAFDW